MTRVLVLSVLTLLAGCTVCQPDLSYIRPPTTGEVWDTTYLLDANPGAVSDADLLSHASKCGDRYAQFAQVTGVCWPPWRSDASLADPDQYISGGDSALFTGFALASHVWAYRKTGQGFQRAKKSLEGLWLLTHVTGTPGVIARCAFPANRQADFLYPGAWQHRIDKGFVNTGPAIPSPLSAAPIPPHIYYTRATRDQITGMLLGLAAVWANLQPNDVAAADKADATVMRETVAWIMEHLHEHLVKHNWRIQDENGKNDTSANSVRDLVKVAFLALYAQTAAITDPTAVPAIQANYVKERDAFIDLSNTLAYSDRFNNTQSYFGHNLRASRALTIWLIGDATDKQLLAKYVETNVWRFTKGHQNGWIALVRAVLSPADAAARVEGINALRSLSLKPLRGWSSPLVGQEKKPPIAASALNCTAAYVRPPHLRKPTSYFTWQKEPWDVGDGIPGVLDKEGLGENTGVGFLLPYWMARFFGAL